MLDSMTQILSSGPIGSKINIAVLGDGFVAGADQTTYNDKVQDLLINGALPARLLLRGRPGVQRLPGQPHIG
jgi:hypothetical protein